MIEDPLRQQLARYRELTEGAAPPAELIQQIVLATPRRARTRAFVRDAHAGLLIAAALGAAVALLAAANSSQVERQLIVQIGAWAEG